ncbi:MAG: FHA domain-containing protein [Planctomycetaceae bacterium]
MLQAELRVVGGRHHNHTIPLSTAKFLIGREHDCQLRPNSESVSRHHCVFTVDEFTVRIRDLGSTNGTFVNGEQVKGQVVLQSGDRVSVGKLEFIVEIHEPEADQSDTGRDNIELPDEFSHLEDAGNETIQLTQEDTIQAVEIDHNPSVHGEPAETGVYGSDTTIINPGILPPGPGVPVEAPVAGMQPAGMQPGMMPYGMPPPYAQPYGAYPPPGYPGYGYPPMPMYMPQYPPQMYPQPGMGYAPAPGQPQAAPAPTKDSKKSEQDTIAVRLPEPSSTGYVTPPPPAPVAPPSGDQPVEEKQLNPSEKAADIIRNFMQRRPGQ